MMMNQIPKIKITICLKNISKKLKKITLSQFVFRGPTFMDQKKSVSKMRKDHDDARQHRRNKRLRILNLLFLKI